MTRAVSTENRGSRYRFLQRIATGGMAELYLGEATGVGGVSKRVALKRMLPAHSQDSDFLDMFLSEARLASTLQHPNIVQTYDVIHTGEEYIIVMEFLEGSDLQQFRRRMRSEGHTLSLQHALYIATNVLSGMHYAHERTRPDNSAYGIVHRDISPQNIFLTYDGGVKLLDFGIAKTETNLNRTASGVLKGKVLYMAPEQCAGLDVDRRADIYSLGVVLYQLLTGTVPHRGKNAYDTMRSIIDDPCPRPRALNPRLHEELERIVIKALEKQPAVRYSTAREMLVDLEAFAQKQGLYASTIGFSTLVEKVLGPRRSMSEATTIVLGSKRDLPPPISTAGPPEAPTVDSPRAPSAAVPVTSDRPLVETEHATLRRLEGCMVLSLSGALNEQFDTEALEGKLKGVVLIDTQEVSRITSFGIRTLMNLFNATRSSIDELYHIRSSVPFINQVGMIRALLGGGQILSFHAPYLDPETGSSFTTILAGQQAREALDEQRPPAIPSPTHPDMSAEFDDDPELYFAFADDFQAEVPSHVAPAIQMLEDQARKLEVELTLGEHGTSLWIRQPIRAATRWRRVVQGLEGRVRLELEETPAASADGARALVQAISVVHDAISHLTLVGAPLAVCAEVGRSSVLLDKATLESAQLDTACVQCRGARRVTLPLDEIVEAARDEPIRSIVCARCGGALELDVSIESLAPWGVLGQAPQPPASQRSNGGCLKRATSAGMFLLAFAAVLLVTVLD